MALEIAIRPFVEARNTPSRVGVSRSTTPGNFTQVATQTSSDTECATAGCQNLLFLRHCCCWYSGLRLKVLGERHAPLEHIWAVQQPIFLASGALLILRFLSLVILEDPSVFLTCFLYNLTFLYSCYSLNGLLCFPHSLRIFTFVNGLFG